MLQREDGTARGEEHRFEDATRTQLFALPDGCDDAKEERQRPVGEIGLVCVAIDRSTRMPIEKVQQQRQDDDIYFCKEAKQKCYEAQPVKFLFAGGTEPQKSV